MVNEESDLPKLASPAQRALAAGASGGDLDFYRGKLYTCRYFFGYELPKIEGLVRRLLNSDGLTVEMTEEYFAD